LSNLPLHFDAFVEISEFTFKVLPIPDLFSSSKKPLQIHNGPMEAERLPRHHHNHLKSPINLCERRRAFWSMSPNPDVCRGAIFPTYYPGAGIML